jgi:hypothetical protein
LDDYGRRALNVAFSLQKPGEQVQLWPYDCKEKTFIVGIYAKSFFPPPRFQADGFLILNETAEIIQDRNFCLRVVRDFFIWHKIYFSPPAKYVPFKKQFFAKLRQIVRLCLENCKNRYENNLYKNDDPAKKAYNTVLKELDLDVIRNSTLLLKNIEVTERILEVQKSIWQRCSCEKIEELRKNLIEYRDISTEMANYTAKRGEIFYRYERAIKDAYKIELQVSHHSILSKLALSLLLWLANTNLYAVAIPFLPDVLKIFYQTFAGYKSLIKKSKNYLYKAKEINSLLDMFEMPIQDSKIRNF